MDKLIKKLFSTIFILISIILLFPGCQKDNEKDTATKSIEITISDKSFVYQTEKEYLHDALLEMKEKGIMSYEYSSLSFGTMINNINGLVNDDMNNKYISLFHNIDNIEYIDYSPAPYGKDPIIIDEITYRYSSTGVSLLPVINNSKYLFVLS
jgi:hypothetical protein